MIALRLIFYVHCHESHTCVRVLSEIGRNQSIIRASSFPLELLNEGETSDSWFVG
jgi:hypothetical protein